jgi:hypothetical protein
MPGLSENPIGVLFANFYGSIITIGVDHNNFIGPFKTFEAATDVFFFIFSDYRYAYFFHLLSSNSRMFIQL